MSKVLVTESNLLDIADAIRSKNEGTDTYRPGDMAAAILAIPTGSTSTLVSKTITQNGEYDPEDDNADGYSDVTVNVPNSYTAEDEGKVVSSGALVAQTNRSVTENGTYDTTENDEVVVNVSGGGGGYNVDVYSQYLDNVFDTEAVIKSGNRIEIAFYANSYVNDGHIAGQSFDSTGNYFHLTTYSNKWYVAGTRQTSFNATNDYPVYGADIVFSAKTGEVKMNDIVVTSDFTMPDRTSDTYKLNTRGGSISTTGVYKYKYVKVYDANDNLLCHWEFGTIALGNSRLYLAHETVSDIYKPY